MVTEAKPPEEPAATTELEVAPVRRSTRLDKTARPTGNRQDQEERIELSFCILAFLRM
jgi:hypothetical protein